MNSNQPDSRFDLWSDWLLHRRHADDPEYERVVRALTERYADRVRDGARLTPGMTIADIGAGDVPDKVAALREFHRILKPGGRLSIAEPVLRDDALLTCALRQALNAQLPESSERFLPLMHRPNA